MQRNVVSVREGVCCNCCEEVVEEEEEAFTSLLREPQTPLCTKCHGRIIVSIHLINYRIYWGMLGSIKR